MQIPPRITPYAWAWPLVSLHAIFPVKPFGSGLAIGSRDIPPISPRSAGHMKTALRGAGRPLMGLSQDGPRGEVPAVWQVLFRAAFLRTTRAPFSARGSLVTY